MYTILVINLLVAGRVRQDVAEERSICIETRTVGPVRGAWSLVTGSRFNSFSILISHCFITVMLI